MLFFQKRVSTLYNAKSIKYKIEKEYKEYIILYIEQCQQMKNG